MGVRLIRLADDETVVGVERLADQETASADLAELPEQPEALTSEKATAEEEMGDE
jgi:hypothetical protein